MSDHLSERHSVQFLRLVIQHANGGWCLLSTVLEMAWNKARITGLITSTQHCPGVLVSARSRTLPIPSQRYSLQTRTSNQPPADVSVWTSERPRHVASRTHPACAFPSSLYRAATNLCVLVPRPSTLQSPFLSYPTCN